MFWKLKGKNIKAHAGFQLMNYRLVVIALEPTVLAGLLDNKKKKLGKNFFLKIIINFINILFISIGYTPQYGNVNTTLISHIVYIL